MTSEHYAIRTPFGLAYGEKIATAGKLVRLRRVTRTGEPFMRTRADQQVHILLAPEDDLIPMEMSLGELRRKTA